MSGPTIPVVAKGPLSTLRASAILTATYVYSSIVDVSQARYATLFVTINGASAANEVSIVPLGCASEPGTAPLSNDDVWFAFSVNDGSVSANDMPNALPSGADFTYQPNWGRVTLYPAELRFKATTGTTDKIRMKVKLDVSDMNWLQIMASDVDASGTLSTLAVSYLNSV